MNKLISFLMLLGMSALVLAEAPVVDYSTDLTRGAAKPFSMRAADKVTPVVTHSSDFSVEQRIGRLEQQVNNLNIQNPTNKIEELQQNLQKLNGQLETQSHQIEQLQTQLKDFYQDLNKRLEGGAASVSPAQGAAKPPGQNSAIVPAIAGNGAGIFAGDGTKKVENLQPAPANSDSAFLKEQQMYQTAIDLLPDKKHESESKLREYLKQYPKGIYVANAHYWLGEINFLQKSFDAAEEEFKIVVDKYPTSKRVSDAALKLALVHHNQGREVQAKQELRQIIKKYPGTSAAQLAKQQLAAGG